MVWVNCLIFLRMHFFLFRIKLYLSWLWCPRPLQPMSMYLLVWCSTLSLSVRSGYSADVYGQAADRQQAARAPVNLVYPSPPHDDSPLSCLYHVSCQLLAYLTVFHLIQASVTFWSWNYSPHLPDENLMAQRCKDLPQGTQLVIAWHLKPISGTNRNVLPLNCPLPTHALRHGPVLSSLMASPNQGGFLLFALYCFSPGTLLQMFKHSITSAVPLIPVLYMPKWEWHLSYVFQEML